jgi:hypothetical protein
LSERTLDWNGIKEMLAQLRKVAPHALNGSVLVGGAACWAYRVALSKAADSDFKVPPWTSVEENNWLSKDVDFANINIPEIPQIPELRIGYVQFGIRLGSSRLHRHRKTLGRDIRR